MNVPVSFGAAFDPSKVEWWGVKKPNQIVEVVPFLDDDGCLCVVLRRATILSIPIQLGQECLTQKASSRGLQEALLQKVRDGRIKLMVSARKSGQQILRVVFHSSENWQDEFHSENVIVIDQLRLLIFPI